MKTMWPTLALVLALPLSAMGQSGQQGDYVFWVPFKPDTTKQQAQIQRNANYVSIKLHSVYVYYKSGFLENIRSIVISSEVALERNGKLVQGDTVHGTLEKSRSSGDFVGVNAHLAVLAPATPPSVQIQVKYQGIGEDRFRQIFDLLSGSDLKVPLDLSDATLGKVAGITPILRKFLATPYTSAKPKQVLDVSQSFVLYSDALKEYPDALREGFLVVISSRENKSAELTDFLKLPSGSIQIAPLGGLVYKNAKGEWQAFSRNSYVILTITETSIRGENQSAAWFHKYIDAEEATTKINEGKPLEEVKSEAVRLWKEGNLLLAQDENYIQDERDLIRARHLDKIEKKLKSSLQSAGVTQYGAFLKLQEAEMPANYAERAAEYERLLAQSKTDPEAQYAIYSAQVLRDFLAHQARGGVTVGIRTVRPCEPDELGRKKRGCA